MLTSQGKRREEEGTEWDLPDFRARERRMTSVTTMLSAVGWFWGRWTGLGGAGPEGSGGVGLTGLFFFTNSVDSGPREVAVEGQISACPLPRCLQRLLLEAASYPRYGVAHVRRGWFACIFLVRTGKQFFGLNGRTPHKGGAPVPFLASSIHSPQPS